MSGSCPKSARALVHDHCPACAAACHLINTGGRAYSGSCCKCGKRLCMLAFLHVLMPELLRAICKFKGQLLSWQWILSGDATRHACYPYD